MDIKKLSEEEFNATFIPPMSFMDVEDETSEVDLKLFAESVIVCENLQITSAQLEIDSIYHNSTKTYEHVLINYGVENRFLVVVVDLKNKIILGYHMLDLNQKFGLDN